MGYVPPAGKLYDDWYGFTPPPDVIRRQHEALQQRMSGQTAQPGQPMQGDAAQQQSDQMYKKIQQLTEGRANELRKDPVQQQTMKYLQGVLGGQNVPYSDNTMNAMKAQYGRGAASAEEAQMQSLRDSLGAQGGSIYDPSYQAAGREAQSQRQGRNLDYAGQLNSVAGLENFNAKSAAAGQMGALNTAQNSMINQMGLAGAGYQAQRFQQVPSTPNPGVLMPQYGGGGSAQMGQAGGGAAPRPAAPMQPSSAPAQGTTQPAQAPKYTKAPQPYWQPQQDQQAATTQQSAQQTPFGSSGLDSVKNFILGMMQPRQGA